MRSPCIYHYYFPMKKPFPPKSKRFGSDGYAFIRREASWLTLNGSIPGASSAPSQICAHQSLDAIAVELMQRDICEFSSKCCQQFPLKSCSTQHQNPPTPKRFSNPCLTEPKKLIDRIFHQKQGDRVSGETSCRKSLSAQTTCEELLVLSVANPKGLA